MAVRTWSQVAPLAFALAVLLSIESPPLEAGSGTIAASPQLLEGASLQQALSGDKAVAADIEAAIARSDQRMGKCGNHLFADSDAAAQASAPEGRIARGDIGVVGRVTGKVSGWNVQTHQVDTAVTFEILEVVGKAPSWLAPGSSLRYLSTGGKLKIDGKTICTGGIGGAFVPVKDDEILVMLSPGSLPPDARDTPIAVSERTSVMAVRGGQVMVQDGEGTRSILLSELRRAGGKS